MGRSCRAGRGTRSESCVTWQRRLDRSGRQRASHDEAFVAVEVLSAPANVDAPIEVAMPSAYRVQVLCGFDAEHLRRLLDCLERQC